MKKTYKTINALRTIACIGIVMMHMRANNAYELTGYFYNKIIPSFADFVFLFMVISAFGLCYGYHEKILSGNINLTNFYKKRYLKILPFFTLLVIIDVVTNFSLDSLYEAIANLSLTYGLFPNHISVIGVGWFLGLIFAFYFVFPFFCVLTENKLRAWISLVIALVLNYIGDVYFDIGRNNIVYCLCYFIAGGLIYLYKDKFENLNWTYILPILIIAVGLYYLIGWNTYTRMFLSAILLIFALVVDGNRILSNKFTSFISGISMEIYLSHMFIYRVLEKLHLNNVLGNGIIQYLTIVMFTTIGAIIFSIVFKKIQLYTEGYLTQVKGE